MGMGNTNFQEGRESLFDTRCREAFRILQAMYEGTFSPDQAVKEWERVRRETSNPGRFVDGGSVTFQMGADGCWQETSRRAPVEPS